MCNSAKRKSRYSFAHAEVVRLGAARAAGSHHFRWAIKRPCHRLGQLRRRQIGATRRMGRSARRPDSFGRLVASCLQRSRRGRSNASRALQAQKFQMVTVHVRWLRREVLSHHDRRYMQPLGRRYPHSRPVHQWRCLGSDHAKNQLRCCAAAIHPSMVARTYTSHVHPVARNLHVGRALNG